MVLWVFVVFRYDPPNDTTRPHSVYMFQNLWSFLNCDLSQARMVGNQTQWGGDGFEFVLKRWKPLCFAWGEHDGLHCKDRLMRFSVFQCFVVSVIDQSMLKTVLRQCTHFIFKINYFWANNKTWYASFWENIVDKSSSDIEYWSCHLFNSCCSF